MDLTAPGVQKRNQSSRQYQLETLPFAQDLLIHVQCGTNARSKAHRFGYFLFRTPLNTETAGPGLGLRASQCYCQYSDITILLYPRALSHPFYFYFIYSLIPIPNVRDSSNILPVSFTQLPGIALKDEVGEYFIIFSSMSFFILVLGTQYHP